MSGENNDDSSDEALNRRSLLRGAATTAVGLGAVGAVAGSASAGECWTAKKCDGGHIYERECCMENGIPRCDGWNNTYIDCDDY